MKKKEDKTEMLRIGLVGLIAVIGLIVLFLAAAGTTGQVAYQTDAFNCLQQCDASLPFGTAAHQACQQNCLPYAHSTG